MKTIDVKKTARLVLAAGVLTGAALSVTPAMAAGMKAGVLNCQVEGGWGYILGSSKDLHCIYSPINGAPERYEGNVTKFGVDIGYTRGGVLIWDVIAPTYNLEKGALHGGYAGATVSASVGVGGGANVLVGGLKKSISLQPISITGEQGLNVAAGIGAISLTHVE